VTVAAYHGHVHCLIREAGAKQACIASGDRCGGDMIVDENNPHLILVASQIGANVSKIYVIDKKYRNTHGHNPTVYIVEL